MLQRQQQHSTTTTIQEKQKGEAPVIVLQKKFDSIIAKEYDSYNWLKNMLSNQILYDNASAICDYVIAMQQEANISHNTRVNLVANLCKFAKFNSIINNKKIFKEVTREDVLLYLQSIRTRNAKKNNNSNNNNSSNTNEDNKWIGTYNFTIGTLQKFYKWLYYPNVLHENRALPDSVSGFKKIKRKELTTYSANDIWTMQEHGYLGSK
jgi:site-specific recombinase XerD